jgi:hypothetical protein
MLMPLPLPLPMPLPLPTPKPTPTPMPTPLPMRMRRTPMASSRPARQLRPAMLVLMQNRRRRLEMSMQM